MSMFLDHIICCQAVCEALLEEYLEPDSRLVSRDDDYARGKRDQITHCLLSMSGQLKDFLKKPPTYLMGETQVSLRAEFFLSYVGKAAAQDAKDGHVFGQPVFKDVDLDEIWRKISQRIDAEEPLKEPGFYDFEYYSRGCDAGSRIFTEQMLPAILQAYKKLAKVKSPPLGHLRRQ